MHDVLMITHKRPGFTKLSLDRLLNSCDSQMRVWVWQNGPHKETLNVVRSFEGHPKLFKLHISLENKKLRDPTNWFWRESNATFVSKVDDDCLVPDDWGPTLREALGADARLGLLACWLFYKEDFVPELAARKIERFGEGQEVMTHAFVQGSGYVMKRAVYDQIGPIKEGESFSSYGIRAASKGWINGWLFPFIHIDHMDDPRSDHYPYQSDEAFLANLSLSKANFGIRSLAEAKQFSRALARRAQEEIIDPRQYFGWRSGWRKLKQKLAAQKDAWSR